MLDYYTLVPGNPMRSTNFLNSAKARIISRPKMYASISPIETLGLPRDLHIVGGKINIDFISVKDFLLRRFDLLL